MASENAPRRAFEASRPLQRTRRRIDRDGGRAPVELSEAYTGVLESYVVALATAPLAEQSRRASGGSTAVFRFISTVAGSKFECSLDGGPWIACSTPEMYTALVDGPHTFAVRAIAPDGRVDPTPARASWTVKTSAPAVTLTSPANGSTTSNNKPTFSGAAGTASGDSPTITVKVYSGSSASGSPVPTLTATGSGASWSVAASSAMADGTYTAQAEQSDAAGNVGKSSANTFTVESTAPTAPITSAPSGRVPIRPVSMSFTSNEAGSTFQCSLDGAALTTCSSPYNISSPTPGPHTFSVEATNQAGVASTPAAASWSSVQAEQDLCGSLMGTMTIGPDYAARYVLTCNFDIPAMTTLTAQTGAIIKADIGVEVSVEGTLSAVGSSGSPITFTSINHNMIGRVDRDWFAGGQRLGRDRRERIRVGRPRARQPTHGLSIVSNGERSMIRRSMYVGTNLDSTSSREKPSAV